MKVVDKAGGIALNPQGDILVLTSELGRFSLNMQDKVKNFKQLITRSSRILITSHTSPDPDSICSILLLGTTLSANFPDKKIVMHSEELLNSLQFVPHYAQIKSGPLSEALNDVELVIMVDAMNYGRCTREDAKLVSEYVQQHKILTAILDHHQPVDIEAGANYINREFPAAVEEVYEVCFNDLQLQKPRNWAQITMTGLYSDTAGFTYLKDNYQKTLQLLKELLDEGLKLEEVKIKLNHYQLDDLASISHVLSNIKSEDSYNYSYLKDDFVDLWVRSNKEFRDLLIGIKFFADNFMRNIGDNHWGFAIYKDLLSGDNIYSVSFRSLNGSPDVAALANKLGGGGHKGAAGCKVKAQNLDEAIAYIKSIILKAHL